MDSFIKKIFHGNVDNQVHLQFQKFSRGEFINKALINATKIGDKISISTTYEYVNEMVRSVAELIPAGEKVVVTGVVVSTRDLSGEFKFQNIKQFMGIKQYVINSEMTKNEVIQLCDKFPMSFIALSFSVYGTELKIKPKAPKSAKPSTSGEKAPKPNFCKLKTSNLELVKNYLFEPEFNLNSNDFKKIEISHDFIITNLEIPKNEKDPAKMREMTIRKGKIVRKISIDGKEIKKEKEFEA